MTGEKRTGNSSTERTWTVTADVITKLIMHFDEIMFIQAVRRDGIVVHMNFYRSVDGIQAEIYSEQFLDEGIDVALRDMTPLLRSDWEVENAPDSRLICYKEFVEADVPQLVSEVVRILRDVYMVEADGVWSVKPGHLALFLGRSETSMNSESVSDAVAIGRWSNDSIAQVSSSERSRSSDVGIIQPVEIDAATSGSENQYTDEALLEALRQAASTIEGALSGRAYDDYRAISGGPSRQTIIHRFLTWSAACQAAEVVANPPRAHAKKWTKQELIEWVARYLAKPNSKGTYNEYLEWAKETNGAPSGPTLRQTYPSWAPLKEMALSLSALPLPSSGNDQPVDDEVTSADLSDAAAATSGTHYLREWGAKVVLALEGTIASRKYGRVDNALFRLLKSAGEFVNMPTSPFDGMLEAPESVIAVYQGHHEALMELAKRRDAVLGALLNDVAGRVLTQLPRLSWAELEAFGAVRMKPERPEDWDLP